MHGENYDGEYVDSNYGGHERDLSEQLDGNFADNNGSQDEHYVDSHNYDDVDVNTWQDETCDDNYCCEGWGETENYVDNSEADNYGDDWGDCDQEDDHVEEEEDNYEDDNWE